jgi:hypothetical protein
VAKLHGLDIPDLDPGVIPLKVVAILECLDENGRRFLTMASTDDIMAHEAGGYALWLLERARAAMRNGGTDPST